MPTATHSSRYRIRWRRRPKLVALGALVVAVAAAIGLGLQLYSGARHMSRTDFRQHILNGLVTGRQHVAPGATAYVLGPHGSWAGAAGVANLKTGERMRPDSRMRIQSLSKTWLLVVMLQLAQEGRLNLDDPVAYWLPGLLPHHGSEITIRQLMTDSSGLIDDNDLDRASTSRVRLSLARVKDAKLRAELTAAAARIRANPNARMSPLLFIEFADWQPLVATPGSRYHHSNIGWNIAGLVAARAAGKPLPQLYRERLFTPLGLTHTAYEPQGPIAGRHAEGYLIGRDGSTTDATGWTYGKGADGAIVTDAADEARFLRAILTNKLRVRRQFLDFYGYGWPGRAGRDCPGNAFSSEGAGSASRASVYYDPANGGRIAVLLLNGARGTTLATDDPKVASAAAQLYCSA